MSGSDTTLYYGGSREGGVNRLYFIARGMGTVFKFRGKGDTEKTLLGTSDRKEGGGGLGAQRGESQDRELKRKEGLRGVHSFSTKTEREKNEGGWGGPRGRQGHNIGGQKTRNWSWAALQQRRRKEI